MVDHRRRTRQPLRTILVDDFRVHVIGVGVQEAWRCGNPLFANDRFEFLRGAFPETAFAVAAV